MVASRRRLVDLITSTAPPGLPTCIAYGRWLMLSSSASGAQTIRS